MGGCFEKDFNGRTPILKRTFLEFRIVNYDNEFKVS